MYKKDGTGIFIGISLEILRIETLMEGQFINVTLDKVFRSDKPSLPFKFAHSINAIKTICINATKSSNTDFFFQNSASVQFLKELSQNSVNTG